MRSMKDFLKQHKQSKAAPVAQLPQVSPETKPPAKVSPPGESPKKKPIKEVEADSDATLTYACQHKIGVHYLKERDCDQCKSEKRAAKMKAKREQRALKNAAKEQVAQQTHQRLPDGSRFDVKYNAADTTWSGMLTVPSSDIDEYRQGKLLTFIGTEQSLSKLNHRLDAMYRAWLVENAPKEKVNE
jgi:hypothetical protein